MGVRPRGLVPEATGTARVVRRIGEPLKFPLVENALAGPGFMSALPLIGGVEMKMQNVHSFENTFLLFKLNRDIRLEGNQGV